MKKVNIITLMVLIMLVSILFLSGCTSRENDLQPSDSQTSSLPASSSPSSAPSVSASEPPAPSSTPSASSSETPASSTPSVQPSAPPVEPSAPSVSSTAPPVQPAADVDASTVKIELSTATVSISDLPMPVSYQLHNKSSKEITVEPYYEIERYDGSRWVSFPFSSDDPPNWPEGNVQLEPNGSMDDSMSIWFFAEEITPGTYRVVKEIAEADKPPIKLNAEFVVE